eukprot:4559651-Amphidinium_carterae.2
MQVCTCVAVENFEFALQTVLLTVLAATMKSLSRFSLQRGVYSMSVIRFAITVVGDVCRLRSELQLQF